ncbi:MAG: enolase C-terminal domain-like protein [archaeon]
MLIKRVKARKIKDSRKEYTIEVKVNNCKASSPSGKSKGKHETKPYRKSLNQSIKDVNSLNFQNINIASFQDLKKVEHIIKRQFNLKDPKQFGANALFALESAILKSLAKEQKKQLFQIINPKSGKIPIPVGNAIGGGLHSHNKNHAAFQEFLIIPKNKSPKQNIKTIKQIYKKLKKITKAKTKNDEGAWQTSLTNDEILLILSIFKNSKIGIDAAASSFYKNSKYKYKNKTLNKKEQIEYMNFLISKYNLFYVEDPLHEEDFEGFSKIIHSNQNLIVGDDLTATQIPRLKEAIKRKAINAMIIKPNQNGSLIELRQIFLLCKKHNIKTILSHRSGETLDNTLADLAVGFQSDFIKAGISTKWRKVKLKRLGRIEKSLKTF